MNHPLTILCTLALTLSCFAAVAQDGDPEKTATNLITPETEAAIERGLTWLASRQQENGSFNSGSYRGNVAITGLCGMAFMAGGSTPGRGPYGGEVARAVDYILDNAQQSGFIAAPGSSSHGPMYGHGFATLFLAECYGMSNRPDLREKLAAAVKLIANCQNNDGGWRYYPVRAEADLSVTICQVMALRAARNAGIYVPNETIDKCIDYVRRSQNPDGGFKYMVGGPGESRFALTAAGLVALYSAGVYEGDEITKGLNYLMKFLPGKDVVIRDPMNYYHYAQYYAVQAAWQAGGDHWARWYPAIRDELLKSQRKDGSWLSSHAGAEYGTAMSLIVLQMPENYLPIFQR